MAELNTAKLNAESHLLLEQPLLRLPYELSRKNHKTLQRHVEREHEIILATLKSAANASLAGQNPGQTLTSLDTMITRMQGLKHRLEILHKEEEHLRHQTRRRIKHVNDLYDIPSLADVKYDEWSRVRLNRLLVDYLLRSGYGESARALAREKDIEDLVDVDVFVHCHRIEMSLKGGSTTEALAWCAEHKHWTKARSNNLEFQLRLQQFIELVREGKLLEARQHAQKYIASQTETHSGDIHVAAGLLAFQPNTQAERYKPMFSPKRWDDLASLFVKTHHELLSLPTQPLLHIALQAGLSALKTPSCHSAIASSSSNASSSTTTVCPICSTELNELAKDLPYANQSTSSVENEPIVLPNGRIYGRDRLMQMSAKVVGLEPGHVKDPTTGEVFEESKIRKVFIM